jgi:hypothetical protein
LTSPSSGSVGKLPLTLRQAMEKGECVLFLGAGIGAHYTGPDGKKAPTGDDLAKELIQHFKLNIAPTDLPRVAQLVEIRNSRDQLDAFIKKRLANLEPDEHIQWLSTFQWRSIFTTNYDIGLERAYKLNDDPPQNPVSIAVTADLRYTDNRVDVPIFHLHGTPYPPCSSPIVITQSDYTRYQQNREMVWNRLKNDGVTSTILYIGYSGRDPNWQLIIEEMAREFLPGKPPISYRIDPYADALDIELHREVRRIETLPMSLPQFRDLVDREIGGYRPAADTLNQYRNTVPQHLREHYDRSPAPMIRLLQSWNYVNDETVTLEPNTKDFLRGSRPSWSLIAQNRRFTRDIEEEVWDWITDFATNPKAKSTALAVTAPAGYGITTILMALALKIVGAKQGPVFMLREGEAVAEGDIAYAATLFPDFPCYFVIDQAREHAAGVQASLAQQRKTLSNCLFILGERRNEWLSANPSFSPEEFDVEPLSDGEINRLLDFLAAEKALGELEELDRPFQFSIIKKKHEQQLLVAMREATAGEGVGFDAIIDNEYRGIGDGNSAALARELYLLVCCFYQHGTLIRDQLLEAVLGVPLLALHQEIGTSLEGLVDYVETNKIRGLYAARARHRIIAEIVWKKCGSPDKKEKLLQRAMEELNLTYALDKTVFDLFTRSDDIIDSFRTLEGKTNFFETAARRDPNNVFVLQHFARMLLREHQLTLALSQIDNAIQKDRTKSIRSLRHTRGLILGELAMTEENGDVARKWLAQSEREFVHCIASKESDDYGHTGLANLYLEWSRRKKISDEEATEYLEKAETVVTQGLRVARARSSLLITSAEIEKDLGNQPARLSKLRQAVESNSASSVSRYLLARAYRQQGEPQKTMTVLEPIIRTDFSNVRAYVEYTKAMLRSSEPVKKCLATLSQCKVDGESDPAFIGLYGGLLFMDGRYADASKLWDTAKERRFSYEERTRRRYTPRDPSNPTKRLRCLGTVEHVKPGYVLIQPDEGPIVISTVTVIAGVPLTYRKRVSFELTFSAKGPLAEALKDV